MPRGKRYLLIELDSHFDAGLIVSNDEQLRLLLPDGIGGHTRTYVRPIIGLSDEQYHRMLLSLSVRPKTPEQSDWAKSVARLKEVIAGQTGHETREIEIRPPRNWIAQELSRKIDDEVG